MIHGVVLAGILSLVVPGDASAPTPMKNPAPRYDPTDHYVDRHIDGWRVRVNRRLLADKNRDLAARVFRLLDDHLYRIQRVVPAEAVAHLHKVPIWVELAELHHPCMCYHVSPDWLREHDMNPEKAKGVEIANARTFLSWTHEQPWMVLHELAHAYHDQVLGFENRAVHECYESAVREKLYDAVLHYDGKKVRAYALNNDREYFAECTEAFFGQNDFYPFVRAELRQHDPRMYKLLEKVWR